MGGRPASLPSVSVASNIAGSPVGMTSSALASANSNEQLTPHLRGQPAQMYQDVPYMSSPRAFPNSVQGYVEPGPVSNGYSQSGLEHPSNEAWGVKGTSLLLAAVAATAAGGVWWRRRAQAL